MGRKKRYHERMIAAFPKGKFRQIDKALDKDEDRTGFIRTAVDWEIQCREAEEAGSDSIDLHLHQRAS